MAELKTAGYRWMRYANISGSAVTPYIAGSIGSVCQRIAWADSGSSRGIRSTLGSRPVAHLPTHPRKM